MAAFFSRPFNAEPTGFAPLFRLLDDFENYSRESQQCGNEAVQSKRAHGHGHHPRHAGGSSNNNTTTTTSPPVASSPARHTSSPWARALYGNGYGGASTAGYINPSFDVRETETAYELHGDLPGVAKEDVHIAFTEPQTLNIKGSVRRNYHAAGTSPVGLLEGAGAAANENENEGEQDVEDRDDGVVVNNNNDDEDETMTTEDGAAGAGTGTATRDVHTPTSEHNYRPASVADEEDEEAKERGQPIIPAKRAASTAAAAAQHQQEQQRKKKQEQQQQEQPKEKFWISERSFGEFSRTFTFPSRVENGQVSARLENGVLSVTVPKQKDIEPMRIAIL